MKKEWFVRPYQPGDEEKIVQLLNLVWDGWPHLDLNYTSLDHWKWKYKDNPLKKDFIAVGVSDNRVIGCSHRMILRIKIGDGTYPCTIGTDLAVHPDFRRLGISRSMNDLLVERRRKEGVILSYMITGNPILIKNISKRRLRFPYPIVNLVRIQDIDAHLKAMPVDNAWLMKLGFKTVKVLKGAARGVGRSKSSDEKIAISEISSFDDRIEEFWRRISSHYDFIIERRRDYLNWRYCDPRAGEFVVRYAEENGEVIGYSVLHINRYNRAYPIGYVVELLALPGRLDAAEVLAAHTVHYFDYNDINLVNYQIVNEHPYVNVLERHGFLDSRIKMHLFYKSIGDFDMVRELGIRPRNRILISWGDHDILPVRMPSYR